MKWLLPLLLCFAVGCASVGRVVDVLCGIHTVIEKFCNPPDEPESGSSGEAQ